MVFTLWLDPSHLPDCAAISPVLLVACAQLPEDLVFPLPLLFHFPLPKTRLRRTPAACRPGALGGGPGSKCTPGRAWLWAQEGQSQVQAPRHLGQARRWLTCLRLAVPGFGRGLSPAPGPGAQHILCWGCSPLGSYIPCVLGRWAQGKGRFASLPHWAVHFHFALSLANYITDPVCQDQGQQRSSRGDEVGIRSSR